MSVLRRSRKKESRRIVGGAFTARRADRSPSIVVGRKAGRLIRTHLTADVFRIRRILLLTAKRRNAGAARALDKRRFAAPAAGSNHGEQFICAILSCPFRHLGSGGGRAGGYQLRLIGPGRWPTRLACPLPLSRRRRPHRQAEAMLEWRPGRTVEDAACWYATSFSLSATAGRFGAEADSYARR